MSEQIIRVPLDRLLPWDNAGRGQPRKFFDPAALQELADSMKTGFIGSITVRPFPGRPGYMEILAGHRRHKAAQLAGGLSPPAEGIHLAGADGGELLRLQSRVDPGPAPGEAGPSADGLRRGRTATILTRGERP